MPRDFIYDPRVRRMLGLPPMGGASAGGFEGGGGMSGGGGASFPPREGGMPFPSRRYTNADIPGGAPGVPPSIAAIGTAPAATPPRLAGMPSYSNADLPGAPPPPAPAPGMPASMPASEMSGLFDPQRMDPLGMHRAAARPPAPAAPAPAPPAPPAGAPPPTDIAGAASLGTPPVRGIFPGAGTFGLVQPTDTTAEELGRSKAGTPASGNASNRSADPDAWSNRQYGLPGILNATARGHAARGEAIEGGIGAIGNAIASGGRAVANFFAGRPQEQPAPAAPGPARAATGTTTRLPNGQDVVRADARPNAPPKAAPRSIEQAAEASGQTSKPRTREDQGPPASLSGTPTYTNADLDRVRAEGPSRGGFVMGSEESLPMQERLEREMGRRALDDIRASGGSSMLPSQRRALEYEREKGNIAYAAMEKLIDEEAERQVAEVTGMANITPQQRKVAIENIRAEALEKKLWNRRLGVAGWPRSGVDTYDPTTGQPLYEPTGTTGG